MLDGVGRWQFEDTVVEIRGILHGVSAGLRRLHTSGAVRREVDQFFVDSGKTPSDVNLLLGQLNQDLAALRITVNLRPEHIVPGVNQMLQLQQPRPVAETLAEFFAQHPLS